MTGNVPSMQEEVFDRINQLEREVASQGAELDSIQESIHRIAQSVDRPINWIGIGALLFGMFSFCLSIIFMTTDPIKANMSEVTAKAEKNAALVLPMTTNVSELDSETSKLFSYDREKASEIAYLRGKIELIETRIEDIDNRGSRELNKILKGQ